MSKVLSAFPYYGGKAKMSPLICSMLDYDNTDIYVEPYGGGCRTLFNKRRHEGEIYNDFGFGLASFMNVMCDREKTETLIEMLMVELPSREQFDSLVIRRMAIEDRLNTSTNTRVGLIALECYKRSGVSVFQTLRKATKDEDYESIIHIINRILSVKNISANLTTTETIQLIKYRQLYEQYWDIVKEKYYNAVNNAEQEFDDAWRDMFYQVPCDGELKKIYDREKERIVRENGIVAMHSYTDDTLVSNELGLKVSDVEVAFIIFQLYYCSRDGMGVVWSEEKNKNVNLYYKAVYNLRRVSERMQGVAVTQVDALQLVRTYRKYDNVMLYLDPSYLNVEDETKNLGAVYRMSYEYKDHEKLLKEITSAGTRAKILISNYDVELYNTYLCDWKKTYYKTFTGVGSKKGNRRVEVLWQNYD